MTDSSSTATPGCVRSKCQSKCTQARVPVLPKPTSKNRDRKNSALPAARIQGVTNSSSTATPGCVRSKCTQARVPVLPKPTSKNRDRKNSALPAARIQGVTNSSSTATPGCVRSKCTQARVCYPNQLPKTEGICICRGRLQFILFALRNEGSFEGPRPCSAEEPLSGVIPDSQLRTLNIPTYAPSPTDPYLELWPETSRQRGRDRGCGWHPRMKKLSRRQWLPPRRTAMRDSNRNAWR